MAKYEPIRDMEEDDEIDETYVGSPDDLLIAHTVEEGLEMAFAERAIVVLTLDRKSGRINIDQSLSTPMETWAIIGRALEDVATVAEVPTYTDEEGLESTG